MKFNNSGPSPRHSLAGEKLTKSLWFTLASSGLSLMFMVPLFASASLLSIPSFLQNLIPSGSAYSSSLNSQTISLLSPVRNIDPSPAVGGGEIALVGGEALMAEEGPSGTAADVDTAPPSASAISVYTVHKGDTLAGIAKMFGVTTNTIVWANDLKGGLIREDDQLVILPIIGVKYAVIKGDTLASIAKKYKADAKEMAQYNDVDDPLQAGAVLLIPNGEVPPTAAQLTQTARAKSIKAIASGKKTEPYLGGSGAYLAGYYGWPVAGGVVTQGLHGWNSVDLGAPTGTSVYAAAAGTVIVARSGGGWNGGYGNYVVIAHANGTQTLYAHLSRVSVSAGEAVAQGTTIGKVGSTGQSTGPHLHFEVRGAANPFAI